MLISKTDFPELVPFSDTINESEINLHISNAERRDLRPLFGKEFLEALSGTRGAELEEFFEGFVKPFLVLAAFVRFLPVHGRNVTQFGITKMKDNTFSQVDNEERGEMLKQARTDLSQAEQELTNAFHDAGGAFDGVSFAEAEEKVENRRRTFALRAPGYKHINRPPDYLDFI